MEWSQHGAIFVLFFSSIKSVMEITLHNNLINEISYERTWFIK